MTMARINDNGTDRDMTVGEQKDYDAYVVGAKIERAQQDKATAAQAAAKKSAQTKLAALGLTADEIAAL